MLSALGIPFALPTILGLVRLVAIRRARPSASQTAPRASPSPQHYESSVDTGLQIIGGRAV